MAVRTKERAIAGPAPAWPPPPAAAVPTVEKMPAPMMAPMPSRVSWKAPRERRSWDSGFSAEARIAFSDLVRKMPCSKGFLPASFAAGRPAWSRVSMGAFCAAGV